MAYRQKKNAGFRVEGVLSVFMHLHPFAQWRQKVRLFSPHLKNLEWNKIFRTNMWKLTKTLKTNCYLFLNFNDVSVFILQKTGILYNTKRMRFWGSSHTKIYNTYSHVKKMKNVQMNLMLTILWWLNGFPLERNLRPELFRSEVSSL